jgi:hypothetical protein
VPSTKHFTFNLMGALARQLEAEQPSLTPDPLTTAHLGAVEQEPGVYRLFHNGLLVYIGKADNSLQSRLFDHRRKIAGRHNITLAEMTFTGLYLAGTWVPVGAERLLIASHKRRGGVPWNGNGFGINDPGRRRDATTFKATHFDMLYPADLTYQIQPPVGTMPLAEALPVLKAAMPYVFRYEEKTADHPDYLSTQVTFPDNPLSVEDVLDILANALPSGWQITALPGYVIMYKSQRRYASARKTWES